MKNQLVKLRKRKALNIFPEHIFWITERRKGEWNAYSLKNCQRELQIETSFLGPIVVKAWSWNSVNYMRVRRRENRTGVTEENAGPSIANLTNS